VSNRRGSMAVAAGALCLGALAGTGGCGRAAAGRPPAPVSRRTAPVSTPVRFEEVAASAGIRFEHNTGAFGKKYYPETMGSGCAFFDYDGDGWPDLLMLNGCDWPDAPRRRKTTPHLYRNRGDGTFEDVTRRAGLEIEIYGIGCAAGDYDNDGRADLYLTAALGPSRLFHNEGAGRFREVTKLAGVDNKGQFATSALWLDYDRDSRLDLFVCNYIHWSPQQNLRCEIRPGVREYCTPETYDGAPCRLYRNLGQGRFQDVSKPTGIADVAGKSMTAALCDYNEDGWPDIVVTNDTQPTFLFRNQRGTRFTEVAVEAGIALGESGKAKAGMGLDAADVENAGSLSILTSNFSGESLSYFVGQEGGSFVDSTALAGFGQSSLLSLGWAAFFFDFDLDGWRDAFVANGHIYPGVTTYQPAVTYAERPLLYRNQGGGRFAEVGAGAGPGLAPMVARGAAFADYDHDGDLDVAMNAHGGTARLLRNDGGSKNQWLQISLEGTKSNRDGVGAVVQVITEGGLRQTQVVRGGSGYGGQNELALTFGLGAAPQAETIEIQWPSGTRQELERVPAGQRLRVKEGAPPPG
jgi:hypothetical protein